MGRTCVVLGPGVLRLSAIRTFRQGFELESVPKAPKWRHNIAWSVSQPQDLMTSPFHTRPPTQRREAPDVVSAAEYGNARILEAHHSGRGGHATGYIMPTSYGAERLSGQALRILAAKPGAQGTRLSNRVLEAAIEHLGQSPSGPDGHARGSPTQPSSEPAQVDRHDSDSLLQTQQFDRLLAGRDGHVLPRRDAQPRQDPGRLTVLARRPHG